MLLALGVWTVDAPSPFGAGDRDKAAYALAMLAYHAHAQMSRERRR
jgi:hypothetical protein